MHLEVDIARSYGSLVLFFTFVTIMNMGVEDILDLLALSSVVLVGKVRMISVISNFRHCACIK